MTSKGFSPARLAKTSAAAGLTLSLAALALAAAAQAFVGVHPWWSAVGFVVAMVLAGVGAPRTAATGDDEEFGESAPSPSAAVLVLLAVGTGLCLLAALGVYGNAPPLVTHAAWIAGLLLFAGAAFLWRGPARRRPGARIDPATLGALLLLFAVCGLLFGWNLTGMPPEVHGDDAEVGLDAIRLLAAHPFDLFESGWFGLPRFHALPTAIGLEVFGNNLQGLRATSVTLGIGTVLLLFSVVRRLWGFDLALLAGLVLASQRFFIHLSRTGFHYVDTALLSVLVLWLFLRCWQDRRPGAAIWCGIALGLGIQTYFASRLVPVLLAATWVLWWLASDREDRRGRLWPLAVVVLVAVATAAPIFGHFAHDPKAFWGRTQETSIFSAGAIRHLAYGYGTDSLPKILLIQLRAALSLFNLTGDTSLQYGYRGGLLEPLGAVLFILGAGQVLFRLGDRRNQLLFVWTAVPLVAGAALTIDAPFYPRISGMVPFTAVIVALALGRLLAAVRATLPGRAGGWAAAAVGAGAMATILSNNVRTYFLEYAPNHQLTPLVEISEWIRANGTGKTTYLVRGEPRLSVGHGAMSFLTWGYAKRDVDDPARDLRPGTFDPNTSLFVILPDGQAHVAALRSVAGNLELEPHTDRQGTIRFYTASPRASGVAPPRRGREPRTGFAASDLPERAIGLLRQAGLAILGAALALAAVLGATWGLRRGGRGASRRSGASRAWASLRAGTHAFLRRVFGPDEREMRFAPPAVLTAVLFVLVLGLAAVLRLHELDRLPDGFYCDEAGLGYNAYSILKTGRDETGALLPLFVWSFDVSYKNPVFIYSSMIPLALLGPTEYAVRLTSAAYGIGTVGALFFLGRALAGPWLGLVAAFLLAVLPWHLHFSRIAFELVAFPFFFILGLTSLVRYTQGRRTLAQAAVLLGFCVYTYAPAKLFVPLFVAGFAALFHRALLRRRRESVLAVLLLALTTAPVVVFDVMNPHRATRYFEATSLLGRDEPVAAKARLLAENYRTFFSNEFLFRRGDRITRHAVRGHGELYPILLPLLLLGALVAVGRRDRAMRLPLWWLALYPLAPALMNEIPSASRGFIGAPGFCLLAAIGAAALLRLPTQILRNRRLVLAVQIAAFGAGVALLAPRVQNYWKLYSGDYRLYSAKYYSGFQFGNREVVEYFLAHENDYDKFVLSPMSSNQAEVFLRFYAGLGRPPQPGVPPFRPPSKMRVSWPEDLWLYRGERRALFAVLPAELRLFTDYEVKHVVTAPDGSPAYMLTEVRRVKDFVYAWRVAGPYPKDPGVSPPEFDPESPPREGPEGRPWQAIEDAYARVRIHQLYGFATEPRCAWAVNFVRSGEARDVQVFAGFDDDGQVWINGEKIPLEGHRGDHPNTLVDDQVGPARLEAGRNSVAVRTCDVRDEWLFYFRLADAEGRPLEGIEWEYDR